MSSEVFSLKGVVEITTVSAVKALDKLVDKAADAADYMGLAAQEVKDLGIAFRTANRDIAMASFEAAGLSRSYELVAKHAKAFATTQRSVNNVLALTASRVDGLPAKMEKLVTTLALIPGKINKAVQIGPEANDAARAIFSIDEAIKRSLVALREYAALLKVVSGSMIPIIRQGNVLAKKLQEVGVQGTAAGNKLQQAGNKAKGLSKNLKKTSKSARDASMAMQTMSRFAGNFLSQMSSMALTNIWQGITRGAREAVDMVKEFNVAIRDMNGLARLSDEKLVVMTERLRTIGSRTGVGASPTEATKGFTAIMAAGVDDPESAMQITDESVKLAKAGMFGDKKAAEVLAGTMVAFSANADEAHDYANTILKATDMGLTDMDKIAQSLGRVAPAAATIGITHKELLAMVGTATAGGMRTQTAITGLSTALTSLVAPQNAQATNREELGVKQYTEKDIKREGIINVLQEMQETTGGTLESWMKILGSKEASMAVMAILKDNGKLIEKNFAHMNDGSDAVGDRLASQMKAAGNQFELLMSNVEAFVLYVGQSLDPAFSKFLIGLNEAAPLINELGVELLTVGQEIGHILGSVDSAQGIKAVSDNAGEVVEALIDIAYRTEQTYTLTVGLAVNIFSAIKDAFSSVVRFFVDLLKIGLNSIKSLINEMSQALSEKLPKKMADMLGMDKTVDDYKKYAAELKKESDDLKKALIDDAKDVGKNSIKAVTEVVSAGGFFGGGDTSQTFAENKRQHEMGKKRRAYNRVKNREEKGEAIPTKMFGSSFLEKTGIAGKFNKIKEAGKKFYKENLDPTAPPKEDLAPDAPKVDIDAAVTKLSRLVELEKISTKEGISRYTALLKQAKTADEIYKIEKEIHDLNKEQNSTSKRINKENDSERKRIAKEKEREAKERLKVSREMEVEWLAAVKGEKEANLAKLGFERDDKLASPGVDKGKVNSWYSAQKKKVTEDGDSKIKQTAEKKAKELIDHNKKLIEIDAAKEGAAGNVLNQKLLELKASFVEELVMYKDNEEALTKIKKTYTDKRKKIEEDHAAEIQKVRSDMLGKTVENEAAVLESKGETKKAQELLETQSNEEQFLAIQANVKAFREAGMSKLEVDRYIKSEEARIRIQAKQAEKAEEGGQGSGSNSPVMSLEQAFGGGGEGQKGFSLGTFSIASKKKKSMSDPASSASRNKLASKVGALANSVGNTPADDKSATKNVVDLNISLQDAKGKEVDKISFKDAKEKQQSSLKFPGKW